MGTSYYVVVTLSKLQKTYSAACEFSKLVNHKPLKFLSTQNVGVFHTRHNERERYKERKRGEREEIERQSKRVNYKKEKKKTCRRIVLVLPYIDLVLSLSTVMGPL